MSPPCFPKDRQWEEKAKSNWWALSFFAFIYRFSSHPLRLIRSYLTLLYCAFHPPSSLLSSKELCLATMRMIDLANQRGTLGFIDTATDVDCGRDVRFRRSFRSFMECVVPCCGLQTSDDSDSTTTSTPCTAEATAGSGATVIGTFFGHRRGRISFCIQDSPARNSSSSSSSPLLLLEFAVPTSYLAGEMQHGFLRITLECSRRGGAPAGGRGRPLFEVPVWSMYCNGRKVGYAVRRQAGSGDAAVLKMMRSVSAGAGVLPVGPKGGGVDGDGDLLYLRAGFERVVGSPDSESFHMINPAGSSGQELSIFLLRS
ncbi:hypothetical protein SAY86_015488 [Trapa natans]|uniref:Protein MIZU-KUSSEI 1 n=1 Tax=Trapa natans TaxID=22666 RepID=A0AAN7LIM9_TRANT|nr:hypothetical protein SAY86_015488 [Trapa natans]